MYKSHLLQVLLNYFDQKDVRIREQSYTIDAQLLNLAAMARESLDMRIRRETNVRNTQQVPLNIDNSGVYYSIRLPNSIIIDDFTTSLNTIVGQRDNNPVMLVSFDDTLPVPTSVIRDTTRQQIQISNPVIYDVSGASDTGGYPLTQSTYPVVLPVTNRITFWLDGMGLDTGSVEVTISGEVFPRTVWTSQRKVISESVILTFEGAIRTKFRWETINSITVRGLPVGARLRAWCLPFNMPAEPDIERPYTNPAYRDQLMAKYWQIQSLLLEELYVRGLDTGLEVSQAYLADQGFVDVAVEPYTNGMLLATNSSLTYIDRREPFPSNLSATALIVQPVCGINVSLDTTKLPTQRWAILRPIRYMGDKIVQYRWTIEDPNGVLYHLTNNGAFVPYSPWQGWRAGEPQTMRIPLLITGTYTFTLECQDETAAITKDAIPYGNFAITPLATLSVPWISNIQGICYDSFGQAWIWTGSFAVPIKFTYDAYILDASTRTIFMTDTYDYIEVSN